MSGNLLRFSSDVKLLEKGVLIDGQLVDGSWKPIFSITPAVNIFQRNTLALEMFSSNIKWQSLEEIPHGMVLKGEDDLIKLVSQVTIRSHDMLRVDVKATIKQDAAVDFIKDKLSLYDFDYESAWTPLQTPQKNMVIGDLAFHSSGIVLQKGARQIALMPNFRQIGAKRKLPLAMTIDKTINELSFGHIPYEISEKGYYVNEEASKTDQKGVFKYSYFVYYQNNCKTQEGIRRFVHRSWRLQGESKFGEMIQSSQNQGQKKDLLFATGEKWLKKTAQEEEVKIYNDVQICTAQSAYGMALLARQQKNKKCLKDAREIINKIVQAPRLEGLLPAIFDQEWQMGGIAGPDNKKDLCRLTNCSWTAYWLAKWYLEIEKDPKVLEILKEYGERLIKFQRHGGHIPSWIRLSTFKTVRICAKTAEVSVHAIFLNKLYSLTKEEIYLKASRRIVNFIIREVLPAENWENTEIYFDDLSQSHQKAKKAASRQTPVTHALGLWWTAESLLQLYQQTGTHRYLAFGQRILDRLSYFQQLWDNPWIETGSFGGFGRSNCSDSWNDSIQSYCAKTYLDYYQEVGLKEYYQRGVSALLASYKMLEVDQSQSEQTIVSQGCFLSNPSQPQPNYKKSLIFEQVSGKVLTASAMIFAQYGDLYIDTKRQQAFGLNEIEVKYCRADLVGTAVCAIELTGKDRKIVIKNDRGHSQEIKIKGHQRIEIQM